MAATKTTTKTNRRCTTKNALGMGIGLAVALTLALAMMTHGPEGTADAFAIGTPRLGTNQQRCVAARVVPSRRLGLDPLRSSSSSPQQPQSEHPHSNINGDNGPNLSETIPGALASKDSLDPTTDALAENNACASANVNVNTTATATATATASDDSQTTNNVPQTSIDSINSNSNDSNNKSKDNNTEVIDEAWERRKFQIGLLAVSALVIYGVTATVVAQVSTIDAWAMVSKIPGATYGFF
eukprot:CAMPEP_0172365068 /NCGR_PEP_ID=MMETSP1060-20121228/8058_1 /TAXON_ID=37318 /ORGANISM="Pseudo-nitzschia pungens, Strain cf. cingulata" /LENGTH=240 /DNA_ID=CAMNT_0013088235 /DNA_START=160 /DNA_END=879 /DNA_ORIENTATION=-